MNEEVKRKIMEIMRDASLTDHEKACRRQELMAGKLGKEGGDGERAIFG